MKKSISILLIIALMIGLTGCATGGYDESAYPYDENGTLSDIEHDELTDQESAPKPEAEVVVDNKDSGDDAIEYITERSVQYDENNREYTVFFGFLTGDKEFVSSSGKAHIKITDSENNEIYNKSISFGQNNFGSWSNPSWNESKYLCSLNISDKNFPHCASSRGSLEIAVDLNSGYSFEGTTIGIYNLPEHNWENATCTKPKTCKSCGETSGAALGHTYLTDGKCYSCGAMNPKLEESLSKCNLKLPTLPYTLNEYDYYDNVEYSFMVTDISYEFEVDNDGYISLTLWFSGNKSYDSDGSGQSDSCSIGYKVYDCNDNVVESSTFYSPALAVGEKFANEECKVFYSWDKRLPGTYRLEILSTNHR